MSSAGPEKTGPLTRVTPPQRKTEPPVPPWKVEGHAPEPPKKRSPWLRFGWMLVVLLALNWVISSFFLAPEPRTAVSYTYFLSQVDARNIAQITSTADTIEGELTKKTAYTPTGSKDSEQVQRFTTQRPSFADDNLFAKLQANGVPVNANPPDAPRPIWQQILLGFGPTLLLVGLLIWFLRRAASGAGGGGGGGVLGSFGKSRAKLYQPESGPRTTFADVAGIQEVEQEVT
ncbi:MAG: ATP-dependent metallopeptidase FtsH/Yme1/Tma family protein, partial [Actinoplanes sp.]